MKSRELGPIERRVYGFLIAAASAALVAACLYAMTENVASGHLGFAGIFMGAALVTTLTAILGCRLMVSAAGTKQQVPPILLTIFGTIVLSAVLLSLTRDLFSGGILTALPSALTLAFVAVKGMTLAARRFISGA